MSRGPAEQWLGPGKQGGQEGGKRRRKEKEEKEKEERERGKRRRKEKEVREGGKRVGIHIQLLRHSHRDGTGTT